MSSESNNIARTLATLEVHQHYLGMGQKSMEARLVTIEATQHSRDTMLSGYQEHRIRLQQVEAAVRLIKAAGGILMFALAASGQMGGVGEKAVAAAAKMLLGSD